MGRIKRIAAVFAVTAGILAMAGPAMAGQDGQQDKKSVEQDRKSVEFWLARAKSDGGWTHTGYGATEREATADVIRKWEEIFKETRIQFAGWPTVHIYQITDTPLWMAAIGEIPAWTRGNAQLVSSPYVFRFYSKEGEDASLRMEPKDLVGPKDPVEPKDPVGPKDPDNTPRAKL